MSTHRRKISEGDPALNIRFLLVGIVPNPSNLYDRGRSMVRRTRDIQKKIWLTPQEERTIAKKMEMIGTENFGAYARKMLIDGYIIVVDYTEQKKLAAEINKIGVNINTVCRRINSTGRFYQDDIDELKEKMDAVWQLLKSKQSEEL